MNSSSAACEVLMVQTITQHHPNLLQPTNASLIRGTNGNVEAQDKTDILHVLQDVSDMGTNTVTMSEAALMKKYDLEPREPCDFDLGMSEIPDFLRLPEELTEYQRAIIPYLAGFAGRLSCKQILCPTCVNTISRSIKFYCP